MQTNGKNMCGLCTAASCMAATAEQTAACVAVMTLLCPCTWLSISLCDGVQFSMLNPSPKTEVKAIVYMEQKCFADVQDV